MEATEAPPRARPRRVPDPVRAFRNEEPLFGERSASDWENWREHIFGPAAIAVGLPGDTIRRDLRGSFASLLIFEGLDVVEVASPWR